MNNVNYQSWVPTFDRELMARLAMYNQNNTLPQTVTNQILIDWETHKHQIISKQVTMYAHNGGPPINVIQQTVNAFIDTGLNSYCRGGGMQQQSIYPQNGMPIVGNNYMTANQQYYQQPQYAPMIGNNNMGVNYQPTPPVNQAQHHQDPTSVTYDTKVLAPATPEPKAETITDGNVLPFMTPAPLVTTKYVAPSYNDKIIDTWVDNNWKDIPGGSIKVKHMVSPTYGEYDHILLALNKEYTNTNDIISDIRKLIPTDNKKLHVEVIYNKLITLEVPFERMNAVFTELKKEVPIVAATPNNKLKYISTIESIINKENRGTADTIDKFFVDQFMKYAIVGCGDSDQLPVNGISIGRIHHLTTLADKQTTDKGAKNWQAIPGFDHRLVTLCEQLIKDLIIKCKILDPSNPDDIDLILDSHEKPYTDEDGLILDIANSLYYDKDAYIKASTKERAECFGLAGKIVNEHTSLIIASQKLIYTDFIPEGSFMTKNDGTSIIIAQNTSYGGDEPESTDLEWLLVNYNAGERPCDVVVVYDEDIFVNYKLVQTTDRWLKLYR